jgi:hypothetical protein
LIIKEDKNWSDKYAGSHFGSRNGKKVKGSDQRPYKMYGESK